MKCAICKKEVRTTFLSKKVGTFIKLKGKKQLVCQDCQKAYKTKEQILSKLPL
ncbi:MAG: hypothetical protein ABIG95_03605 [Candidatus Woesearchaeota archaeon]